MYYDILLPYLGFYSVYLYEPSFQVSGFKWIKLLGHFSRV